MGNEQTPDRAFEIRYQSQPVEFPIRIPERINLEPIDLPTAFAATGLEIPPEAKVYVAEQILDAGTTIWVIDLTLAISPEEMESTFTSLLTSAGFSVSAEAPGSLRFHGPAAYGAVILAPDSAEQSEVILTVYIPEPTS